MANKQRLIELTGQRFGKLVVIEYAGRNENIADPWYTGNFDDTWDGVLEGCTALLNKIKAE